MTGLLTCTTNKYVSPYSSVLTLF